jgi:hypothetical protein
MWSVNKVMRLIHYNSVYIYIAENTETNDVTDSCTLNIASPYQNCRL